MLAYASEHGLNSRLTWFDRTGKEIRTVGDPAVATWGRFDLGN
jgi:hypothetical protein